nr:NAD-dependent epimerase/dehydratase family protein [Lachnospiraceae bacterium]
MKIILLGAAGFIGTNLVIELAKDKKNLITVVDRNKAYFKTLEDMHFSNVKIVESDFSETFSYDELLKGQELVYHLISTTVPTTSNQHITEELKANVLLSANLLEACVHQKVKKIVFLSSGGTVYGKESKCPLNEKTATNPITSYGVQKVTIEKLIYLYSYM